MFDTILVNFFPSATHVKGQFLFKLIDVVLSNLVQAKVFEDRIIELLRFLKKRWRLQILFMLESLIRHSLFRAQDFMSPYNSLHNLVNDLHLWVIVFKIIICVVIMLLIILLILQLVLLKNLIPFLLGFLV